MAGLERDQPSAADHRRLPARQLTLCQSFPPTLAGMDLTVCICTHDRPLYVRDCLNGLRQQTVRRDRFAILLVDSASSAHAAAELADMAAQHDARLIRLEQPEVSLARNAGAWAAWTHYIAYIDDDAIPAVDWFESVLESILQPGRRAALIGGRILPKWE